MKVVSYWGAVAMALVCAVGVGWEIVAQPHAPWWAIAVSIGGAACWAVLADWSRR